MKGALEPLVVYLSGLAYKKYTPYILERIDTDNLVLKWLRDYTAAQVEEEASDLIKEVITQVDPAVELSPEQVQALLTNVVSTYSFIVNADKLNKL
jgi:hypothetical protein